jgi:hypothetical protein
MRPVGRRAAIARHRCGPADRHRQGLTGPTRVGVCRTDSRCRLHRLAERCVAVDPCRTRRRGRPSDRVRTVVRRRSSSTRFRVASRDGAGRRSATCSARDQRCCSARFHRLVDPSWSRSGRETAPVERKSRPPAHPRRWSRAMATPNEVTRRGRPGSRMPSRQRPAPSWRSSSSPPRDASTVREVATESLNDRVTRNPAGMIIPASFAHMP